MTAHIMPASTDTMTCRWCLSRVWSRMAHNETFCSRYCEGKATKEGAKKMQRVITMPDLSYYEAALLAQGFTIDPEDTTPDRTQVGYWHPEPEMATKMRRYLKDEGLQWNDDRYYGPNGMRHTNHDHPQGMVQVAKHNRSASWAKRGTHVSVRRSQFTGWMGGR